MALETRLRQLGAASGSASASTGGSGTPGGADTQIQFNDGGSFGGDAGLTWNKTTDTLKFGNTALTAFTNYFLYSLNGNLYPTFAFTDSNDTADLGIFRSQLIIQGSGGNPNPVLEFMDSSGTTSFGGIIYNVPLNRLQFGGSTLISTLITDHIRFTDNAGTIHIPGTITFNGDNNTSPHIVFVNTAQFSFNLQSDQFNHGTVYPVTDTTLTSYVNIVNRANQQSIVLKEVTGQTEDTFVVLSSSNSKQIRMLAGGGFVCGGSQSGQSSIQRGLVINSLGGNAAEDNTQIQSDSYINMVLIHASNNAVGINQGSPKGSYMHFGSGIATHSPIRLTSGALLTTATSGTIEYDGIELYYTPSTLRYKLGQVTTGNSVISSGTYTPTLTNVANVAASSSYQCQYMRIGNTVSVSGRFDIDPTLTVTATQLGISIPVSSNFGSTSDCGGTAFASAIASQGAAILADTTNDRAEVNYVTSDVTNQPMYFSFMYEVI